MSEKIIIHMSMELLSDTIFGSGYNVTGGEDIGVCTDKKGYPYLKGSTLKGLLRESAENLCAWNVTSADCIPVLFGEEGWSGVDDGRRIVVSSLVLRDPPAEPAECFDTRAFTAIENGLAKKGTLRTASCLRAGAFFDGQLICDKQDAAFLEQALQGIQHLGTLRNRGFGHVRFSFTESGIETADVSDNHSTCLEYTLRLLTPVVVTDAQRSSNNVTDTKPYISGSAVRGMVMGRLAQQDPAWFEDHKTTLLSDRIRFLDALPLSKKQGAPIPSPMGFYEDPAKDGIELSLVEGYNFEAKKRAKLGSFCNLNGTTVQYWSPETDSAIRIRRAATTEDAEVFQTGYLCEGQTLRGYIMLDDPALAPAIRSCFARQVWIGADRYEGFGKCEAVCEDAAQPAWIAEYGIGETEAVGTTLYMMLLSPTALSDRTGTPCPISGQALSEYLGTEVTVTDCATAVADYHAYNRVWQCRSSCVKMYERGSLFKLSFREPPSPAVLGKLQKSGIGIRRAEGFGQVLFLRADRIEALTQKQLCGKKRINAQDSAVKLRRARIRWIKEKARTELAGWKLSRSQIGDLQSECQRVIALGGNSRTLEEYLTFNENRGGNIGWSYKTPAAFIRTMLRTSNEVPVTHQSSIVERMQLVCALFDYQRKLPPISRK